MTIRDALIESTLRLEEAHVPNARLTAEHLLASHLAVDRAYLFAHDDRILTSQVVLTFRYTVELRAGGVPTQYIVGRQEFFGRNFAVDSAVLIPRPETELLVECALRRIPRGDFPSIVDVGTGSGAIAVTVALERPEARVIATDISFEAIDVARRNASSLGATVSFVQSDLIEALAPGFDFVLSNPPYIDPADAPTLDREVRDHEPAIALFAPEAGLGTIRRLIPAAAGALKPGGYLIFEIGMGMESRVLPLFGADWLPPSFEADLQGIPRTVIARGGSTNVSWLDRSCPPGMQTHTQTRR